MLNVDSEKKNQTNQARKKQADTRYNRKIKDGEKKRALEASLENGASIWLTALPLKEHGFALDKQAFWDAIRLRYAIPLHRLPTSCVCGAPSAFSMLFPVEEVALSSIDITKFEIAQLNYSVK